MLLDKTLGGAASDTSVASLAFTTTNAVAAGGFIVVGVTCSSAQSLTSVTGGGLTWTIDKTGAGAAGLNLYFVSAQAPAGLASGTSLTANYSAATTARSINGVSFTGAASTSPVDTSSGPTALATTAWTTASTTIKAGSVLLALAENSSDDNRSTITAPSVEDADIGGGAATFSVTLAHRIESIAGAYTVAGTWAAGTVGSTIAVAYKAAPDASPAAPSVWPIALSRFRNLLRLPTGFNLPGDFTIAGTVFTDSGSGTVTLTGSGTQSHTHSNSASGTITLGGSFVQAFSHSGSASGTITLSGTRTESQTGSNSASGTITLSGTRTESETHSNSASGTITLSGTGIEDFHAGGSSFNDSGTGTITLAGTRTENAVLTDSRTGTVTLTGSGVESFTHSGSRTGTITLTGTANEVWGHVDSGTGTITLTAGARTESQSHVSSATGLFTLFGSSQEDFHGFVPADTAGIHRLRRRRWPQP